jgi:hypothetical protein
MTRGEAARQRVCAAAECIHRLNRVGQKLTSSLSAEGHTAAAPRPQVSCACKCVAMDMRCTAINRPPNGEKPEKSMRQAVSTMSVALTMTMAKLALAGADSAASSFMLPAPELLMSSSATANEPSTASEGVALRVSLSACVESTILESAVSSETHAVATTAIVRLITPAQTSPSDSWSCIMGSLWSISS